MLLLTVLQTFKGDFTQDEKRKYRQVGRYYWMH